MESVTNRDQADELLATQIDWHHKHHTSRSTGLTPHQAVEQRISEASVCWRPAPPPELLDLHLATHHTRVVQKAGEISFLGRRWEITPRRNQAGDHRSTARKLPSHLPPAHATSPAVARHRWGRFPQ